MAEITANTLTDGEAGGSAKVAVNAPLGDKAALRVTAFFNDFAGFIDSVQPNLSIKEDVNIFTALGLIKDPGIPTSLLAKLDAAADARARGNCAQASSLYQSFVNALEAQSGKGVDPTAAAIMIADAQFLIAHCP